MNEHVGPRVAMEFLLFAVVFSLACTHYALRPGRAYDNDFTRNFTFTIQRNGSCEQTDIQTLNSIITGSNTTIQDLQCTGIDLVTLDICIKDVQDLECSQNFSFYSCCNLPRVGYEKSDVYIIRNTSVYCDIVDYDSSWLVMLYRNTSDTTDFRRPFTEYERYEGFGPVDGSHWLGLEFLHQFTEKYQSELQIELFNETRSVVLSYNDFHIDSKELDYTLRLGAYSGTLPDYLSLHNGYGFSTFDQDLTGVGCPDFFEGGWWYHDCWNVFFTGTDESVYWGEYVFTAVTMKFRPKVCPLNN